MKKILIGFLITIIPIFQLRSQWVFQNSGTTRTLNSVSIVTDHLVWASGGLQAIVVRTTDAGANWINVTGTGIPTLSEMIVIAAFDENTAVIGTNKYNYTEPRRIYRTTNGGQTWNTVFNLASFINGLSMKNQNEAYFVGDPVGGRYPLYRTTNKGLTWDSSGLYVPQVFSEVGVLNSLFVSEQIISFGTDGGILNISTNDGINWIRSAVFSEAAYVKSSFFLNQNTGMATGSYTLVKTTNGGINWISTGYSGSGYVNGVCGYSNEWWIGRFQMIYYSSNFGNNWIMQDSLNINYLQDFRGKYYNGKMNMWGVGMNGRIINYSPVVGIRKIESQIPIRFSLSQNYPNPFNPSTTIRYELPENSLVNLVVFDDIGREIETLVNEKQSAGIYETSFNGSQYPSGVFFYRLKTDGFVETKKMILLK